MNAISAEKAGQRSSEVDPPPDGSMAEDFDDPESSVDESGGTDAGAADGGDPND